MAQVTTLAPATAAQQGEAVLEPICHLGSTCVGLPSIKGNLVFQVMLIGSLWMGLSTEARGWYVLF